MNLQNLINKVTEYISTSNELEKKRYKIILSALKDETFLQLLTQQEREELKSFSQQRQSLSWYKQSSPRQLQHVEDLYFKYLVHLNDKRRRISDFDQQVKSLEEKINAAQENIGHIDKTAKLISGASVLAEYAREFDERSITHKDTASGWLRCLIVSVVVFVILICALLFIDLVELPLIKDLFSEDFRRSGYLSILVLTVKSALVFAYLQIPLFIKRNYYAEKHLEQASVHRKNVLKALHAVYNSITDQVERDKIITTGATIAFSEPESGYITRKEGAGDGDITVSLLSRFWK